MVPDLQARSCELSGALVDLDPAGATRIQLHWQQWKLRSPSLDLVAEAIRVAARENLDQRAKTRAAPADAR
jgi:LysR family transcriptional regulator (chromosome initiation inhibitor)